MSKSKGKSILHRTVLLEKLIAIKFYGSFIPIFFLVSSYDDEYYQIISGDDNIGGLLRKSRCKRCNYNEWI